VPVENLIISYQYLGTILWKDKATGVPVDNLIISSGC